MSNLTGGTSAGKLFFK